MRRPHYVFTSIVIIGACLGQEQRFSTQGEIEEGKCPTLFVSMAGLGTSKSVAVPNPCDNGEYLEGQVEFKISEAAAIDPVTASYGHSGGNFIVFTLDKVADKEGVVRSTSYEYNSKEGRFKRKGALHVLLGARGGTLFSVSGEGGITVSQDGSKTPGSVAECSNDGARCSAVLSDGAVMPFLVDGPGWALSRGCHAEVSTDGFAAVGSSAHPTMDCVLSSRTTLTLNRVGGSGEVKLTIDGSKQHPEFGSPMNVVGGAMVELSALPDGVKSGRIACRSGLSSFGSGGDDSLAIPAIRAETECTVTYGTSANVSVSEGGSILAGDRSCGPGSCVISTNSSARITAVANAGRMVTFSSAFVEVEGNSAVIPQGSSGNFEVVFLEVACVPPTITLEATAPDGSELVDLDPTTPDVVDLEVTSSVRFRAGGDDLAARATLLVNGSAVVDLEEGGVTMPMQEILASPETYELRAQVSACGSLVQSSAILLRQK